MRYRVKDTSLLSVKDYKFTTVLYLTQLKTATSSDREVGTVIIARHVSNVCAWFTNTCIFNRSCTQNLER